MIKRAKPIILLLLWLLALGTAGCTRTDKALVKEALQRELGSLPKAGQEGVLPSRSYEELFAGASGDSALLSELSRVYASFFRDFEYRVEKITLQREEGKATAQVRAKTRDGVALAKTYAAALLQKEMLQKALGRTDSLSQQDRCRLLGEVLNGTEGDASWSHFPITLRKTGDSYRVSNTDSLENALVGGFLSAVQDPYLLTPQETLSAWFDGIKAMDLETLAAFFDLTDFTGEEEEVAMALLAQVQRCFDYRILSSWEESSGTVSLEVSITTFSEEAIRTSCEKALREYLGTAEAVIDGEEARYEKAFQLLLSSIRENTLTSETALSFTLIHSGTSWCLAESPNEDLGAALFGTLPGSLVSMESLVGEE